MPTVPISKKTTLVALHAPLPLDSGEPRAVVAPSFADMLSVCVPVLALQQRSLGNLLLVAFFLFQGGQSVCAALGLPQEVLQLRSPACSLGLSPQEGPSHGTLTARASSLGPR